MPTLGNPRHERFAQLVASGIRPQNAYVSVGFSKNGAHQSAGRTLRIASVKARVVELQAAAADSSTAAVRFDHDRVLGRLDELSRVAQEKGQLSAAVRAEELIGRARGLFVERSENVSVDMRAELEKQLEQIVLASGDQKLIEQLRAGEPKDPVQ
jgi:septum formation inhibitor-activating ATPase MinD